jgi:uncharacterized membrane protein (DUF4010 family)
LPVVVFPLLLAELTSSDAAGLGVALAIGLLFGVQRERTQAASGHRGLAGARTFPLVSLLGAMSVLATGGTPSWLTAVAFVGVAALSTAGYVRQSRDSDAVGLTTEVLLLLAFVLGAAAAAGLREAATIVGAASLVLVAMKERLHGFAGRLTQEDESAFLKFVAVALLVVPLLPDRDLGPFDAINPHDIGRMAVLVAGISFLGFVAVKTVGVGRGLLVTGLLGGLVSTTATTAAFARRSRESPELSARLVSATLAACAVLYPRVVVITAIVSPGFALRLAPLLAPMAMMTVVAALPGFLSARRHAQAEVPLKNPFELAPAIWFALLYGGVVLVSRAARAWFGSAGLYVAGGLAGLTDMDAISLSMARIFGTAGATDVSAPLVRTVIIAAVANAIVKSGIAWTVGSRDYGRRVAIGLLASAVAGVVTVVWV